MLYACFPSCCSSPWEDAEEVRPSLWYGGLNEVYVRKFRGEGRWFFCPAQMHPPPGNFCVSRLPTILTCVSLPITAKRYGESWLSRPWPCSSEIGVWAVLRTISSALPCRIAWNRFLRVHRSRCSPGHSAPHAVARDLWRMDAPMSCTAPCAA